MKTSQKISTSIFYVLLITIILLMIPFLAMQFTPEVNWDLKDFIVMGALIFSMGFSYVLITRHVSNLVHKAAVTVALGSTFLLIWANLAVGLIGSGPNPGNLMYMGVIAVGTVGAILSRFTPAGMERTMFGLALSLVLLAVVALLANMQNYPGSSVTEIVLVNGFFATLFSIAGLLFRSVALKQSQTQ